jgi:hypothetical protein
MGRLWRKYNQSGGHRKRHAASIAIPAIVIPAHPGKPGPGACVLDHSRFSGDASGLSGIDLRRSCVYRAEFAIPDAQGSP